MHVQAAVVRPQFFAERAQREFVAADQFAARAQQHFQHAELGVGQRKRRAARMRAAFFHIQFQTAAGQLRLVAARFVARFGAAQHRLDPRQQFARVKRFRQVVVGAHFQADDAVHIAAARGQHDDRGVAGLAQRAQRFKAVHHRHHHIGDDDIKPRFGGARHRLRAVKRLRHREALALKILPQ